MSENNSYQIVYIIGPMGPDGAVGSRGTRGKSGVKGNDGQIGQTIIVGKGEKGDKGDPFVFSDFTPEQIENLKVKGDKGDDGKPFTFNDFTPEQLESLKVKGDKGDSGSNGVNAPFLRLTTTSQSFRFDRFGNPDPVGQKIFFSLDSQNISGPITTSVTPSSLTNAVVSEGVNQWSITIAAFGNNSNLRFSVSQGGFTDYVTIIRLQDGAARDGVSSFKSIVFRRSVNTPDTPTGGSYINPIPVNWSDGIPLDDGQANQSAQVWMSTRIFTEDASPPQQSSWTLPRTLTDTADIEYQFSAVENNPGNPSTNPENWWDDPIPNTIWMAIQKTENGIKGTWKVYKVKGETGNPGLNGYLTNEIHIARTNKDGELETGSLAGAGGFFRVYAGTTLIEENVVYKVLNGSGNPTNQTSRNNLVFTINASTGEYTLSGMNWNSNAEIFKVIATYEGAVLEKTYTITKIKDGAVGNDGSDGIDAKVVKLIASRQAIKYDQDGLNPDPTLINFTSVPQNTNPNKTPQYIFYMNDSVVRARSTSNTYQFAVPSNQIIQPISFEVELYEGSDPLPVARDEVSVFGLKDGSDSYTVILTNEAHTVPTDFDGSNGDFTGSGTKIKVFQGITPLIFRGTSTAPPTQIGSYRISRTSTGGLNNPTVSGSGSTQATVADFSSMSADIGVVTYAINIRNISGTVIDEINKEQTITKSKRGNAGKDGVDGADGADGSDGVNSRAVHLTASKQAIKYNTVGKLPNPSTVMFTATPQNTTGFVQYRYYVNDIAQGEPTSSNTFIYSVPADIFDTAISVEVELLEAGVIKARDEVNLYGLQDGHSAFTVVVTNRAHTVPTDSNGESPNLTGSGTSIKVFQGTTPVVFNASSSSYPTSGPRFNIERTVTGLNSSAISGQGTTEAVIADYSSMTQDKASAVYAIRIRDDVGETVRFDEVTSFSKSRRGQNGNDGAVGQSSFKSIVFVRQNTQPNPPSGGSFTAPVPSGWSDGIPAGEAKLWSSTRVFTSDGLSPQQSNWTTPREMTNTSYLEIQYSTSSSSNPGNPTTNPSLWTSTPTSSAIWMATRNINNGVVGNWTVYQIKGESGSRGPGVHRLLREDLSDSVIQNIQPNNVEGYFAQLGLGPSVPLDVLIVSNGNVSKAFIKGTVSWDTSAAFIDGSLIVRDAIGAREIIANFMSAKIFEVRDGGAVLRLGKNENSSNSNIISITREDGAGGEKTLFGFDPLSQVLKLDEVELMGKSAIQSLDVFSEEVLEQLRGTIGGGDTEAVTTGGSTSINDFNLNGSSTVTQDISLTNANSNNALIHLRVVDGAFINAPAGNQFSAPTWRIEVFRGANTNSANLIFDQNRTGTAGSGQEDFGSHVWNSWFNINEQISINDPNHNTSPESTLTYRIRIRRVAGSWSAPQARNITLSVPVNTSVSGGGVSNWSQLAQKPFNTIGNGLTVNSGNLNIGTPGTLNGSTQNNVTSTSHTHEIKVDLGVNSGTTAGPVITCSAGNNVTIPTATTNNSGVVTTGNQTYKGGKSFVDFVKLEGPQSHLEFNDNINQYGCGYSSSVSRYEIVRLATIKMGGGSRNLYVEGVINGQSSTSSGVIKFKATIRSNTLPSKNLSVYEVHHNLGREMELHIYNNESADEIIIAAECTSASLQNINAFFTVYSRANYGTELVTVENTKQIQNTSGLVKISPSYVNKIQSNGVYEAVGFKGNGSELTNLNASNLGTGTVPSGRLNGTYNISITGNAATVTNGVYTVGNQTINGIKKFSESTPAPIVVERTNNTSGFTGVEYRNGNGLLGYLGYQGSSGRFGASLNGSTYIFSVTTGGIVEASDFAATSDLKTKENLIKIERGLDKINELTGYTFNRKNTPERREAGYIAQDLEKVLPEGIFEIEGIKKVSNSAVIGILIEAIKELDEKIQGLMNNG